jgi:nucleoside phosphorylase
LHWARTGELNGREVLLAANGAGGARAAQAVDVAQQAGRLDLICSMGFCGGLEETMNVGDIFVASRIEARGREYTATRPQTGQRHHTGALVSLDRVAQTAREKRALHEHGASAVDMEAGGVAAKASELQLPFYCIRSVTDLIDESFSFDFNAALRSDGRFDTMRLIAASCRRPLGLLPELVRLERRCRAASRTLGDFLADCRF